MTLNFVADATAHVSDEAKALVASVPTGLLIGGTWRDGSTGERIDVTDPATGELLASVASATPEDGLAAVDAAATAFTTWATTAPRVRGEILRKAFELMIERVEDIARLITLENGKSLADARGEAIYAAEFFRWFSEEAVRGAGEVKTAPNGQFKMLVLRQPVGVAVLVTPWNFPAAMATRKIGPALAAGCTVVLKPASETPLTALLVAEILREAGVPDGVVNVVCSKRSGAIVSAMLHDPRVRKLSFTGSTQVGSILLREAADCIVNPAMELGGNAPFVVFDDADLDAAIAGAMIAKMRNGGEACTAANRFIVQRGIADRFAAALADKMGSLVLGPGLTDGVHVGPLVNKAAVDKVAELVGDAVERGATVVTGGSSPTTDGFFYAPTVITNVPAGATILAEEIFGPVAPIVVFDTEDEAVELANASEFGLVGYVFTGDLARGLRVSEGVEAGMIGLNRGLVSDPAAPFGGMKQSGLGREGGHEGLLEYTESKYIAVEW